MRGPSENSRQIRGFLLEAIASGAEDVAARGTARFQLSRQAIHRHLSQLLREGLIEAEGQTRSRRYSLAILDQREETFALAGLEEHLLWRQVVEPWLGQLADPARRIWGYGFSEMVNNAIDHSAGQQLLVWTRRDALSIQMGISDNGVGIFRNIQSALGLEDQQQAVLELAKGKLTTDPARHTGEGIFFTSRAFDEFVIASGDMVFMAGAEEAVDWIVPDDEPKPGTTVFLKLRSDCQRSLTGIFDAFRGSEEDYGFKRTLVPVQLLRYGEEPLVSRSQAKRLLARFERFDVVVLDFTGIDMIGQAFADEIFRVFARAHPDTSIEVAKESPEVRKAIQRALAGAAEEN